jgi:hypothetical protein
MTDDRPREDEDLKETYHKVDRRDWLRDNADATDAAPEADDTPPAEAPPPVEEEAPEDTDDVEVDTYGVLRLCLGMLVEQAWVQLGVQLAPGAKDTRADLRQAKLAIDTVAYLKDALGDNLRADEKREVEQILATLRLNFVQRT